MHRREYRMTIRLPLKDYERIKELVNRGYYRTPSDFVRTAIRCLLDRYFRGEEVV